MCDVIRAGVRIRQRGLSFMRFTAAVSLSKVDEVRGEVNSELWQTPEWYVGGHRTSGQAGALYVRVSLMKVGLEHMSAGFETEFTASGGYEG